MMESTTLPSLGVVHFLSIVLGLHSTLLLFDHSTRIDDFCSSTVGILSPTATRATNTATDGLALRTSADVSAIVSTPLTAAISTTT